MLVCTFFSWFGVLNGMICRLCVDVFAGRDACRIRRVKTRGTHQRFHKPGIRPPRVDLA